MPGTLPGRRGTQIGGAEGAQMLPFDPEYLRREFWSPEEAAYLLAGVDPAPLADLDRARRREVLASTDAGKLAVKILANLNDAIAKGSLPSKEIDYRVVKVVRVVPRDAVVWAKAKGYDVPEQLMVLAEPQAPAKK